MATKTQLELETLWTTQNGIDGVDYRFGDIVRVKTGEHIGKSGEIIALISIEVEPTYLIELQTGDSIAVKQSELDPAQGNSGRRLILQAQ